MIRSFNKILNKLKDSNILIVFFSVLSIKKTGQGTNENYEEFKI